MVVNPRCGRGEIEQMPRDTPAYALRYMKDPKGAGQYRARRTMRAGMVLMMRRMSIPRVWLTT